MIPTQPNNPSKRERYELLKYALSEKQRPEDFNDIVSLLSPPKEITTISSSGECKGVKVGIIGGGISGLSAAFELRKLGFDITIFEAECERIGGRVYTYYFDKDKDLYGEFGAMRIPVSHESTWHYIDLFKLNTTKYIQYNKNSFVYAHNTRVRNTDENIMKYIYPKYNLRSWEKKIPFSKILDSVYNTSIVNLPHYLRKQLLQIREFYNSEILFFDSIDLRKAFEILGYSEGVIDLVQSVAALDRGLFNYSYLEALREEYPANFSFLYQIEGGAVNLPLALYNSLIDTNPKEYNDISPNHLGKVNWKNGCLVDGIYLNKSKTKVIIKYSDKFLNKSKLEAFDYIICTIPFSSLRNVEIFPSFCNKKMQAIREINYVNSQKTLFLCDKKFWLEGTKDEKILGGGSYTDLPISTTWYPSNSFDKNYNSKDSPGVLLSSYNIDLDSTRIGNLNNTRKLKQIKSQVEKVHGLPNKYLDNIVKDYKSITWDKEFFFGAFSIFYPELTRLYAYSNTIPEFNNKVFFAGEHISTTHAWQQGALKTGMEAANSLAKICKFNK